MENERVILAIGRIERALSRAQSAIEENAGSTGDPALEKRHAALKSEMQQAIQTIDGMIARQEH